MTTKVKPMRNSNARTPRLLSLSVLALLAGCSMAPIYERPPGACGRTVARIQRR